MSAVPRAAIAAEEGHVTDALLQARVCAGQVLAFRDLIVAAGESACRRELADAVQDAAEELRGVAAIFDACATRLLAITESDLREELREEAGDAKRS